MLRHHPTFYKDENINIKLRYLKNFSINKINIFVVIGEKKTSLQFAISLSKLRIIYFISHYKFRDALNLLIK